MPGAVAKNVRPRQIVCHLGINPGQQSPGTPGERSLRLKAGQSCELEFSLRTGRAALIALVRGWCCNGTRPRRGRPTPDLAQEAPFLAQNATAMDKMMGGHGREAHRRCRRRFRGDDDPAPPVARSTWRLPCCGTARTSRSGALGARDHRHAATGNRRHALGPWANRCRLPWPRRPMSSHLVTTVPAVPVATAHKHSAMSMARCRFRQQPTAIRN